MRKDIPQIKVQSAEESQSQGAGPPHQAPDISFSKDPSSHMVLPFLAWPVQDEFGEPDPLSTTERVDTFLRAIYIDLPTGDVMSVQERAMRPKLASAQRIAAKGRTEISTKTSAEVRSKWLAAGATGAESEMFRNFELVLLLFLPEPDKANSVPLELYWGAVDEVLGVSTCPRGFAYPSINKTYRNSPSQDLSSHRSKSTQRCCPASSSTLGGFTRAFIAQVTTKIPAQARQSMVIFPKVLFSLQ